MQGTPNSHPLDTPKLPSFNLANTRPDVSQLIDDLLLVAITRQSSDLHFEPQSHWGRIRIRVDGMLIEIQRVELSLWPTISSRLKIIANLNITEKRLPQDGRFSITTPEKRTYDCRCSSCPTIWGEKIVIRILYSNREILNLENLGLPAEELMLLKQSLTQSNGLLLVTGPTGSGKTITLYSAITLLNNVARNIFTLEDPVEIHLEGINQVEINPRIGFDFSAALKALMRQDPDVLMVGEIRDADTAKIAINAAHTGHLVLATLHTNSAAGALTRMLNLGVPPYNLINALKLVLAQRLLRKLCPHCKQPTDDPDSLLRAYGLESRTAIYTAGPGCPACYHGYHGRIAIFELLQLTQELRHLISQENNWASMEQRLHNLPYKKLRTAALERVIHGDTSIAELERVIG